MADLRELRRIYSIRDVLEKAGVNVRKKWMVCPLPLHPHAHNTPSFSIFMGTDGVERFRCHGTCGAFGDVIDLAGYLWVRDYDPKRGGDIVRAVEALTGHTDISFPTPETRLSKPDLMMGTHLKYLPIGDAAREYAHGRGLNDDTIEWFQLGQDGDYLTIPVFLEGRLLGIKKRLILPTGLRFLQEAGSKLALFNHDGVAYRRGYVFYVKAEIPTMLLTQQGLQACATNSGEGAFDPAWIVPLAFADVIVIGDNDETGRKTAEKRAIDLRGSLRFPPEQFKDVDEWILADPLDALITLRSWEE